MGLLWKRKCQISVEGKQLSNLDVRFSIKRQLGFGTGTAKVEIYNLSKENRVDLEKLYRANIIVSAGYEDEMSQLFKGDLRTPITVRNGADLITSLEGSDCSYLYGNAKASIVVPPNSTGMDVADRLISASTVAIGNLKQQMETKLKSIGFPNGLTYVGSPGELLQKLTSKCGYELSVQDGQFQACQIGKAINVKGQLLTAKTGLLKTPTPQRSNTPNVRLWNCEALIRPGLLPGRAVRIESTSINADLRIREVNFEGSTFEESWFANMVLEDLRYAIPGAF
jgi:hypothetical protein